MQCKLVELSGVYVSQSINVSFHDVSGSAMHEWMVSPTVGKFLVIIPSEFA